MPSARFSVICDECIRIEWSPHDPGRFVDEPSLFAAVRPLPRRVILADGAAGAPPVQVATSRCTLSFRPDGRPFHAGNLDGQVVLATERGRRVAFWHPGDHNTHNLGGTAETLDGVRGPIPIGEGLLARDGWHLIDDSHGHLLTDGWVAAREWRKIPKKSLDWYFFAYGHDYAAALRALARVAGPVPVPRRAALGSWYSRYWPHTSAEFRGIVADYHQHGIPLDIMVLDMDWHSGSTRDRWTGWSWNRELLPDAEELLGWLHNQGLQVALNLHPADGVSADEDRYAAFMRAQGADPHTGEKLAFDAGNRPSMTALFDQVLSPLEEASRDDAGTVRAVTVKDPVEVAAVPENSSFAELRRNAKGGVDFWWLDWQQERFVPSVPGLTNLGWLNRLFYLHSARDGRRGISLSRWAGLGFGDHRHPVHFSGDAHTGWEMLAFAVPFTVAAGNTGCFYWSHDIGGHFGPRIEECAARWCWFGALSAAMRLHSARTAALDRRPWTYAQPFGGAMRSAFELRASLMPYLDSAAHECEQQSLPLLRPMYLAHPEHERAYRVPAQYTIGRDLLAAPIASPGIGPRHIACAPVWFPPQDGGAGGWYNWFTQERYEPDSQAMVAAAIDEVPLFAPAGVPIPMRTFSHRPAAEPIDHLVIRLFPGEPGTTHVRELHEDDGDTTAYREGQVRRTPITAAWAANGSLRLTIGPPHGTFVGAGAQRSVTVAIGGCGGVSQVRINGHASDASQVERSGLFEVCVESAPVDATIVIEASVAAWTAAEHAEHGRRCREARATTLPDVRTPENQAAFLAAKFGIGAWPETAAPAGVGRPEAIRFCDPFASIKSGTVRAELIERLGPSGSADKTLSTADLDLRTASDASVQLPTDELAEPPVGLRAQRIARVSFAIDGQEISHEVVAESRIRSISEFVVSGPHPWDWRVPIQEQRFEPEHGAPDRAGLAKWRHARRGDKWPVDLRLSFPQHKGLAYAATVLRSARAQTTRLHLDSGDKIEAWLNGAKVFSLNGHDSPEALTSSVLLQLPAGESVLMIKTNDGGGGWGFSATLDGECEVHCSRPH